jgi:predicted TIM-barrel fold metal-dependent hydrolase
VDIVDAQVHVWEEDRAARPWDRAFLRGYIESQRLAGRIVAESDVVTFADQLARMDAIGVSAAVLVTFRAYYPLDNSYALEAAAAHPDRFAVVGLFDAAASDLDDQVAAFAAHPGAVGVRALAMTEHACEELRGGGYDRLFAAARARGLTLCLYPPACMAAVARVATTFPELQIVIDHVGLRQPPVPIVGDDPFQGLPEVLALATFENVAVKLTGLPTLSRQPFPFADLWPHIHAVVDAFGTERVMWGTDTTRTGLNYSEELRYVSETDEFSDAEKGLILAGAARKAFRSPR